MQVLPVMSWDGFQRHMASYLAFDAQRRRQIIFRGHCDDRWPLITTLDRYQHFASDEERQRSFAGLLRGFRREMLQVIESDVWRLKGAALELMARHHGLPTPLLDWTESPHIAAFFAFERAKPKDSNVAVWMLDRAKLPDAEDAVTIVDDEDLLAQNRRAVYQRAVFLRVHTMQRSTEEILSPALVKFVIDSQWMNSALTQLDEMTINAARLFCDLDAAARTVAWRESRQG
jgi:hypothetical protein